MFKYFKRGKHTTRVPRPAILKLRTYIETKQRRLSAYIERKLNQLSPRALTMCLMGFCVAGSSICAFLLMSAIYPKWMSPVAAASPVNMGPHAKMMDTLFVYPSTGSLKNQK